MTAQEAFEAWWKPISTPIYLSRGEVTPFTKDATRAAWLAACAWQKEKDLQLVQEEPEPEGDCPLPGLDASELAKAAVRATKKSIATALREAS